MAQPLAGSGEASLFGDLTVISADSMVAGSSSVLISGLQTNLGSDLQLPANVFLDASRLLRDSCAAAGGGPRSSFTRGGRGGLPPSPDRPLPSAGAAAPGAGARWPTTARSSSTPAPVRWCGRRNRSTAARAGCRTAKKRQAWMRPCLAGS